jgi:hypothetical protein
MTTAWTVFLALLLLAAPPAVRAQFGYSTNADGSIYTYNTNADGSINLARYTGLPLTVTIPTKINGLTVTTIGQQVFAGYTSLTNITIPSRVTSIGTQAFGGCSGLASVTIANGVTTIGNSAFTECSSLTNITFPGSVTNFGNMVFSSCPSLAGVFFEGNAPTAVGSVLGSGATVYYFPGTSGWSNNFAGRPTAKWFLPNPMILNSGNGASLGVQGNAFAFTISWATNVSVVVEACTNLACPVWVPIQTNTLSNGWCGFSEAFRTNSPGSYYRITSQ